MATVYGDCKWFIRLIVRNVHQVIPNPTGSLQRDQDLDTALQVKVRREALRLRAQHGEYEEISGCQGELNSSFPQIHS